MKYILQIIIFGLIFSGDLDAQIQFSSKILAGSSISNKSTFSETKGLVGASLATTWHYSKRIIGVSSIGYNWVFESNLYIKQFHFNCISLGVAYDVLNHSPNKLIISISPQLGSFVFYPDGNNPLGSKSSRWRQSGINAESSCFIRDWLGFSLSISRFFSTTKHGDDFLNFIQLGVVFRTRNKKEQVIPE